MCSAALPYPEHGGMSISILALQHQTFTSTNDSDLEDGCEKDTERHGIKRAAKDCSHFKYLVQ